MVWILFYGSIVIKNNYTALGSSHFQKCHYHNCWIHLKRNTKVIHLHYGGIGCKLWFKKSIFFIQRNKTNVLKCSGLLQNSLRQFSWHIINTTSGWEEPGQWSTPAISTHSGSTLGPAAVANVFWKIIVQVQICQKALIRNIWEFHSHRSLSHNFLGDSCPQVRQQKQLCDGSQPLHFRLRYSSLNRSYRLTKTAQTVALGCEPYQLGSHNIPYPELHCAR